jgi:heterodisulfide reductase subunit A
MGEKEKSVLVVGAGIAGLKASCDLAELGFHVHLVESSPAIGGKLPQHDRWFPTDSCGFCQSLPTFAAEPCADYCLRRVFVHPRVSVLSYSELEKLSGKSGKFTATVRKKSRFIHTEKCILCNKCAEVCPVEVSDQFDAGLSKRKAAYIYSPGAFPATYTIDPAVCTRCGECVPVCPTNAIDLNLKDSSVELKVGAVILALGFEEFNPSKLKSYGYGKFKDVLTSTQFERLCSRSASLQGILLRPSTGKPMKSVAFITCVGSRNTENPYCSAACCMFTLKQAIYVRENSPDTALTVFYMDMRAFGKSWWRYYQKAKELGIKFVRCRVPAVEEIPGTQTLRLRYESESGAYLSEEADTVVLACGQVQGEATRRLAAVCAVEVDAYGFAVTSELNQVKTSREGVFACGSFTGPKDISSSVVDASSAAAEVSLLLGVPAPPAPTPVEFAQKKKVAVLFFTSGLEQLLKPQEIRDALLLNRKRELLFFQLDHYPCLPESVTAAAKKLKEAEIGKVVIAGCIPYYCEALFEAAFADNGMPASTVRFVDLRPLLSLRDSGKALSRAISLILCALSELAFARDYTPKSHPPVPSVLVIGAGVCGLTAALTLSRLGVKTALLAQDERLGGNIDKIYATDSGEDAQTFFSDILASVESDKNLRILKGVMAVRVTGSAGNFHVDLSNGEKTSFSAIIVATGAKEYELKEEDGFPKSERVITLSAFEKAFSEGKFKATSVVMIQCVGSLNDRHPYCSRVCCAKAIKNALRLKKSNPKCEIYILCREVMTYGMSELRYREAREAGIIFVRYEEDKPPTVTEKKEKVTVTFFDSLLDTDVSLTPDFVVLSTGIIPEKNEELASRLGLPLCADGFFEEADSRFRPLETCVPGVFIAGMAQSPQSLSEAILQGKAAATRACALALRKTITGRFASSLVSERWCVGCELCVKVCPVKARTIDPGLRKAVVAEALCVGCGACATVCPSAAAELTSSDDRQMLVAISELIGD